MKYAPSPSAPRSRRSTPHLNARNSGTRYCENRNDSCPVATAGEDARSLCSHVVPLRGAPQQRPEREAAAPPVPPAAACLRKLCYGVALLDDLAVQVVSRVAAKPEYDETMQAGQPAGRRRGERFHKTVTTRMKLAVDRRHTPARGPRIGRVAPTSSPVDRL